uniref:NADH-ubiquinone oxidoreductase chain 2 n=1 Tax=Mekongiella kingdoni TaxID=244710 RepID=X2BUF1_9ORTH|nr:NADH dehydrogenase subunit 2 [Mekongiella kingdoni]ADZ56300.1 NADH dehydrogenase subunit 2 [Mekongiella kingdoni]
MTKNLNKLLFLSSTMAGSMISISSNSWFGVWMGLEINLLSFIPLMVNDKNPMINESSIKYFIVQAVASAMLLFSILVIMLSFPMGGEKKLVPSMMINSSLLIKIGATPFHFWFPEVMKASSWKNCLGLSTWQKMAPMMGMSYCIESKLFITSIVISSIFMGAMGGLNQTSLRQIMAYSSISHLGWMISSMMISETMWEMYFLIYVILSAIMTIFFNQSNLFFVNQIFMSSSGKTEIKFFMILSLLSLGGLPPFLGFLPKWMIIQMMVENSMTLLVATMVMLTTITLYYYIRISFTSMVLANSETSWSIDIKSWKSKITLLTMVMISSLGLISTTSLIFNS